MILTLKKILVIFLTMLQFVAPLVHAHAGQNNQFFDASNAGKLHIPGLENFNGPYQTPTLVGTADQHQFAEGITFGVDSGIKEIQTKLKIDLDDYILIAQLSIFATNTVVTNEINFPCHLPVYEHEQLISSHTPRAPPPAQ